jgi:hypothetical protein
VALAIAAALAMGATAAGGMAAATRSQRGWCKAESSAAWQRVVSRHIVALSKTTPLVPLAVADDGRSIFVAVYSSSFSGVASIDATTGALTRIRAFPDPKFDQAAAAFDGRWLVWNEYHGFDSFNDFTTWAWDARTRKLTQIGAATRGPSGQFWDSPWRGPDVHDGIATWVQGVGPNQLGEVHTYNLHSGRDLVVRHGHPGGAFLLDHHLLIWAEASAPGIPTRMHAASAVNGASARLPRALLSLRNVTGLKTDGSRIAYPDARYKSLWWAPSPSAEPREVVPTRHLHHVDNSVLVSGRYVGFGIYPETFLADTTIGRYVELSNHGGWTIVNHTDLLVVYGTTKKVLHPLLRVAFVPLRDLPPMPICP